MIDPIATPSPASAAAGAQGARGSGEQQDSRKVAEDFTAVLLQMAVREMFETVKPGSGGDEEGSGPFGGSESGGEIYRGMAETAFGQTLAKNGLDSLTNEVKAAIDRVAKNVPPTARSAEFSP